MKPDSAPGGDGDAPGAIAEAAGPSLHARIMAELEALGGIAGVAPVAAAVAARARAGAQGLGGAAAGLAAKADVDAQVHAQGIGHRAAGVEGEEASDREDDDDEGEGDDFESESGPHHLHFDRAKGWLLRVTVDIGKSVIGKRLKFRLRTHDPAEAEKARDLVLATLKRLGLTVNLRMQGKQRGR